MDRYRVVRLLGKGGMGHVYLAEDTVLGRQVALKVLSDYSLPTEERKGRFLREARAVAAVRHPNVATVYEVGETAEGQPYIAMEFCEGVALSQVLQRRVISSSEFLLIARQLAEGLAAAHRQGVIHRDIKSANVILEADGTVKILDFGLAKFEAPGITSSFAETSGASLFGTVPYLSPEQTRGEPATMRSDLFALGIVLYEVATGLLPFEGETSLAVLEEIRNGEPRPFAPLDPAFSPRAAAVITRLLQKKPEDRYSSAAEVAEELAQIEREHVTAAMPTWSGRNLGKTVKRPFSRPMALVIALVLVLGTAGGIVALLGRDDGGRGDPGPAMAPIRSLAVLPFENLSKNPSEEFLSIGLADALTTQLQKIPSLNVRPTSSVVSISGSDRDPKRVGERLSVDGVLEGRFLAAGNVVRVSLQLTDSRSGYGIWAETLEGDRGDLIRLIDQVALRTSTGLRQRLVSTAGSGRSEPRTSDPKAFEHYLRARSLSGSLLPEDNEQQIAELQKAIDLDPSFAAAYAEMGIALALRQVRGFSADEDAFRRAEWYARQAVRLDPNLPEAHLALGRTLVRFPDRYRESLREILAALRLNPDDPQALHPMVTYFVSAGDLQRAACIGDLLVRIDPESSEARLRGYWYINAIDPDAAIPLAQAALASEQTELAGRDILAQAHLLRGDIAAAAREQKIAVELVPDHYLGKSLGAMLAAERGDRAEAERLLASMQKDLESNHFAALRAVLVYARLGDRRKAVEWLGRAKQLGIHNWYYLVRHPWLQPLQQEPEYQKIVSEIRADVEAVRDDMIGVYDLLCRK